jgi:hypothetical protein
MRHIQNILLSIIIITFATASNAQQQTQSFEEQVEEIAGEVKVNLTQGLAEAYGFFKMTEKKANNIMYQTRDGFDQIIYDAQKQYVDKNQFHHHEQYPDADFCVYSVYHCQTP